VQDKLFIQRSKQRHSIPSGLFALLLEMEAFLLDTTYENKNNNNKLSPWLRPANSPLLGPIEVITQWKKSIR
jgi:hypothetical protein